MWRTCPCVWELCTHLPCILPSHQFSHTLWQPQLYSSLSSNRELYHQHPAPLTLEQRWTDPWERGGAWLPVRVVLPPGLLCAPCIPQAPVSFGTSSTPAWGFSFLCSPLAYSHPSSRLCLLYGQQLRTVSFLYSLPWGAAFQMMFLLCSCHASDEIMPDSHSLQSRPWWSYSIGLHITLCNNALCLGKTAVRELAPLCCFPNWVQERTMEVIKGLEHLLCEERLRAGTV